MAKGKAGTHVPKCGARTREGAKYPTCHREAGWGTDHPGLGRCKLHGGKTPITHGRYSQIRRDYAISTSAKQLAELEAHFHTDDDPLNLLPELFKLRAHLVFWEDNWDRLIVQMRDWHESYVGRFRAEMNELMRLMRTGDPQELLESLRRLREITDQMPPKPVKLPDLHDVVRIIKTIGELADRISAVHEQMKVPIASVLELQTRMALVMTEQIRNSGLPKEQAIKVSDEIAEAWKNIQVSI